MNQPPDHVIDAEFQEDGTVRPCLGVVEVPIEAIDGAPAIGAAALEVRGRGDPFVVLVFAGKHVKVRADQLEVALQSLGMLARANAPPYGPPPPSMSPFFEGIPTPMGVPPFVRPRSRRPVP